MASWLDLDGKLGGFNTPCCDCQARLDNVTATLSRLLERMDMLEMQKAEREKEQESKLRTRIRIGALMKLTELEKEVLGL